MCVNCLTPVADHTYRWRGEDEEAFSKQCKLPQHHYLLPEKLDELGHAASWVGYLQEEKKHFFFCFLTERTHYQCVTCVLLLSDLHFRVHTAVDGGDTPGWARGDQSVSCRGEDSPLVLIEGLQWRILAWTLQLVPTR